MSENADRSTSISSPFRHLRFSRLEHADRLKAECIKEKEVHNQGTTRLPAKFKPKCPDCGSILEKAYRGYSCPSLECRVIKVLFERNRRVKKIVREGFDGVAFGRKKKKEGS